MSVCLPLLGVPVITFFLFFLPFLELRKFAMRKIKALCNRVRRIRGWQYCCTSSRRGHYALYRFSSEIDDWFWVRSFSSVGQCLDYLLPFLERN